MVLDYTIKMLESLREPGTYEFVVICFDENGNKLEARHGCDLSPRQCCSKSLAFFKWCEAHLRDGGEDPNGDVQMELPF